MKGVVLAGGLGTRLYPLTKITNKHLLPIYDIPMIYYPIMTLIDAGIRDILIVTGGNYAGEFLRLLGNGSEFGLKWLNYAYQDKELGIAHAISLAKNFVGDDKFVVILGDNILDGSIREPVEQFENEPGAKILLKEVPNPSDYGVPVLEHNKVINVIEKPKKPPSTYAVIGVYMYPPDVFDIVNTLKPSKRGELEVTDINAHYARKGKLTYSIFNGWWGDAGVSIDAYLEVNNYVAIRKKNIPPYWNIELLAKSISEQQR